MRDGLSVCNLCKVIAVRGLPPYGGVTQVHLFFWGRGRSPRCSLLSQNRKGSTLEVDATDAALVLSGFWPLIALWPVMVAGAQGNSPGSQQPVGPGRPALIPACTGLTLVWMCCRQRLGRIRRLRLSGMWWTQQGGVARTAKGQFDWTIAANGLQQHTYTPLTAALAAEYGALGSAGGDDGGEYFDGFGFGGEGVSQWHQLDAYVRGDAEYG